MADYEGPDDLNDAETRRMNLKDQISQVKTLIDSGDAKKLAAQCFHLGAMVSSVTSFPGKQPDKKMMAAFNQIIDEAKCNGKTLSDGELRQKMAIAGYKWNSQKSFENIRRTHFPRD
ncbi:MAG TPA: hypothetical protein VGM64_19200 [Lacunisphaera sp.]